MNHKRLPTIAAFIVALISLSDTCVGANVELTLAASSSAPFNASQEWALELAKLKSVNVRAKRANAAVRPEIKRTGTIVSITGVINRSNQLVVPGRTFSIRQRAALQNWINQQRDGKADATADANKDRFGLTSQQLKDVQASLQTTFNTATKGKRVQDIVQTAARSSRLSVRFSSTARKLLAGAKLGSEWQGFTNGTVIAAALRPLELVMVPKATSGQIELVVSTDATVKESWPVGWKSKLKPQELVPKIYDPLPLEIEETPIADVTAALESRLGTPMQYDSALLNLMQIDPASKKISYSAERTTYSKTLKTTMFRAGLKHEIRVDERGKPFFWISPRKLPK